MADLSKSKNKIERVNSDKLFFNEKKYTNKEGKEIVTMQAWVKLPTGESLAISINPVVATNKEGKDVIYGNVTLFREVKNA